MFSKLRAAWLRLYYHLSDSYPQRWYWPITRIYGGQGLHHTCYMTRVRLTPPTRWGQLYLHVFHREDLDRDPHDHPFNFWTLPINVGYQEDVYDRDGQCFTRQRVPHLRWSFRPAEHTHRVIACDRGWPLVTLVWRGTSKRKWGFWVHDRSKVEARPLDPERTWVHWQRYIYSGKDANANVDGQDNVCPGVKREYRNYSV